MLPRTGAMSTTSQTRTGPRRLEFVDVGKSLRADMNCWFKPYSEAKKMFESDEFAHQRQAMIDELQKRQQQMMRC
jgi:hypothetical protein